MKTLAAVLLVAASAAPARADSRAELEARALFREANRQAGAGELAKAADLYRSAYARFPSPKVLVNLGTALARLGRDVEAAESYERYLRDPGAEPARRAEVERALAAVETRLGKLVVEVAEPGAVVTLDGKPLGTAPLSARVRVSPGEHVVVTGRPGDPPNRQTVWAVAGATNTVVLARAAPVPAPPAVMATPPPEAVPLVPVASPEPAPAPLVAPRPWYRRWWVWTLVGAVVAGAAAGGAVAATRGGEAAGDGPLIHARVNP